MSGAVTHPRRRGLTGQAWCPGSHSERDSQGVFLGRLRGLWAILGGERGKSRFKNHLLHICLKRLNKAAVVIAVFSGNYLV